LPCHDNSSSADGVRFAICSATFERLGYWSKLTGEETDDGYLIYGGRENQDRKHGRVLGRQGMSELLQSSR